MQGETSARLRPCSFMRTKRCALALQSIQPLHRSWSLRFDLLDFDGPLTFEAASIALCAAPKEGPQ